MIKIKNMYANYFSGRADSFVLNDINLEILAGETVAIMGQSGSGKSTLLAVMGGMLKTSRGQYEFRDQLVSECSAQQLTEFRGREIGFVFQNFVLLPHLTILQNLLLPTEHLAMSRKEARNRAFALLEEMGIASLVDRYPSAVSGGQAQRAAIARALMRNPSLVLADEPTGSLDEESAAQILESLKSLAAAGTTVVVVTHSAAVADSLGRTVKIEQGRIIEAKAALAA